MRPTSNYFIVQIDRKAQLEKRKALPTVLRAYLGMKYTQIDGQKGLTVLSVEPDSPAYKAGFRERDTLINVDDAPLETPEKLIEYLWKMVPGTPVTFDYISSLTIQKNGSYQTKTVILGGKKALLENADEFRDMIYNLQYGTINHIGSKAREEMPFARIGDILIFDHKVEYKVRTPGDKLYNDFHLIGHRGEDELRIVDYSFEVFGVINMRSGEIIPHKDRIFCHQHFQKSEFQMQNGVWIPDEWNESIEEMQSHIDDLSEQIKGIRESGIFKGKTTDQNYKKREEVLKKISEIREEQKTITTIMHKARYMELTVLFVNPETQNMIGDEIFAGDKILVDYRTLYPLDIGGVYYTLVMSEMVSSIINDNVMEGQFKFRPLSDQVILKPDPRETKSKGGMHIPDTAKERPMTGIVMRAGPGKKDERMEVGYGDHVFYSKHAGTEITFQEEEYLILRQSQILGVDESAYDTSNNEFASEQN